jgi:Fe2+ transport system protein FeoA
MWSAKTRPTANNLLIPPAPLEGESLSRDCRGGQGGEVLFLNDLKAGQRARIACLQCPHIASCDRLMAYGLTPGQSILLIQKHPAFVIRVDATELALDELVARCIRVYPEKAY